jgi:putative DNA primase/helicase
MMHQLLDDVAPLFSDEDLALRFAEQHAHDLRYVSEISQWYWWDGKRWRPDTRLLGFNKARKVCRAAAKECNEAPHRLRNLASARTVVAVEKLARADQRLAATLDQWDADPWLLNTPDGVIDLRTGKRQSHRSSDHMTKMTAVGPDPECPTKTWLNFLRRVTNKDRALQDFLRRLSGYVLTGMTIEQALFFMYGPGSNGKSVFLETVSGLMGDYAQTSPIETFTASAVDRHPTELARLHGARLVTATETEEGRRWAESRIKQLTGGDRVPARFMRQNFFEYVPQFKLIFAGNHKPGLRTVDVAIKRRLKMIPFGVVIPEDERDKSLAKKLRIEWPGILASMIEGCTEWRRDGLKPPASVTGATEEYFEQEDMFTTWIEEECERQPGAFISRGDLFDSWSRWANTAKEPPGSRPEFVRKLEDHGFEEATRRGQRGVKGLQLRLK